ncbi:MAG: flagellar protein FlgN [Vampirovibrionales bacterium]|nr:flagellar protein FlgN [Vampirovibrionales bacterium]
MTTPDTPLTSEIPELQTVPLSAHSLRQNLEAQLAAHEQVNGLLQQLRQSVMIGKTEAVKSANHQLVQLGDTMARLETERQQLLSKAGYSTMPLRQLMLSMPASEQQCLGQLRDKLNQTIRQVRIEQEDTQSVLAQSIHWVNQTVSSIAKALQPDPAKQNYGPPKPKKIASNSEGPSMATPPASTQLPAYGGGYAKPLSTSLSHSLGVSGETSIIERTA